MVSRAPAAWYWSHDIKPDQIDYVATPGMRLQRLSHYGSGDRRRFAAVVYQQPGAARTYALDLDAAALESLLRETPARPVAITVDDAVPPRFSVVLDSGTGPPSAVHVELDEAGVGALLDGSHAIADLAVHGADGARRYAVVVERRAADSSFLSGIPAERLDSTLRSLDASVTRLREYSDGGRRMLAAVVERPKGRSRAYAGLDADGVARKLEDNDAYPIDLDAIRDEHGPRFTVVMDSDR